MKNFASDSLLKTALEASRSAGSYILGEIQKGLVVEHKGRIDLVTQVDKGAQEVIVSHIEQAFPGHDIIAEEDFNKPACSDYTWFIDPIDGTTNFVHGLPIYCVSIAVYHQGEPLVGVCFNPAMRDSFWAVRDHGAFRNGERLQVSSTTVLINALLTTGFSYQSTGWEEAVSRFARVLSKAQGIRRYGSAAMDLCYVACGYFDGFWESGLKPWDMAAGVLIVKEAGGHVSLLDGSPYDLFQGDILASNTLLHDELMRLM